MGLARIVPTRRIGSRAHRFGLLVPKKSHQGQVLPKEPDVAFRERPVNSNLVRGGVQWIAPEVTISWPSNA